MRIQKYKIDAKRYAESTALESPAWRADGDGTSSGIDGEGNGTVTIPLTDSEGYKGHTYRMQLTETEARRLMQSIFARLEGIGLLRSERKREEERRNG